MVELAVVVLVIRRKIQHRLVGGLRFLLQKFEFRFRHTVNIIKQKNKVNRRETKQNDKIRFWNFTFT